MRAKKKAINQIKHLNYHMDLHMIQRRLMTPLNIYEKGYSCEVRSWLQEKLPGLVNRRRDFCMWKDSGKSLGSYRGLSPAQG